MEGIIFKIMKVSKEMYSKLLNNSINYKQSKYKNKQVKYYGIKFDSKKEGLYYLKLKSMEELGIINSLKLQVKFELQPSFKINNKTIRSINYIADFTYYDEENKLHIVDVKSEATKKDKVYRLKKKLFQYRYALNIEEV